VITETFGKYVDPRIVKGILEDQRFSQGGERRLMTVFFSDLEGFTSLGERLTPDGIVKLLNQYFTLMSGPIRDYHGIIDKYIGDAIMAFWGPPFTDGAEHASLACLSALEQYKKLGTFRQMLPDIMGLRKDLPTINVRMGIATGDVTVGSIGSEYSKGYTVIGDTVNLASRLEAVNKEYGTHLLISEETWKMAKDAIEAREVDCILVAGKSEPVRIFELLERKGQLDDNARALKDHFEEGLAGYRSQSWDLAQAQFAECLKLNPGDRPSKLFLARLQHFRAHPPSPDWDGVWRFQEK
jgi:adenylate cyclase